MTYHLKQQIKTELKTSKTYQNPVTDTTPVNRSDSTYYNIFHAGPASPAAKIRQSA